MGWSENGAGISPLASNIVVYGFLVEVPGTATLALAGLEKFFGDVFYPAVAGEGPPLCLK